MARQALRWAMAIGGNRQPEDPKIRESDVQLFLESQPWFDASMSIEDLYQNAMRLLNTPRELRRSFLLDVLHNVADPSDGYEHLANLVKRGIVRTVLTTNFDDRFEAAYGPGALLVASTMDGYRAISTVAQPPQLVYLHGQAEYYMDRIMTNEVQNLEGDLVARLLPLLRDHPLIVIGYRGAEPSVMKGLMIDHLRDTSHFPQGVFWCVLNGSGSDDLSPMTKELASKIGDNFALVNISGFDEFMVEFSELIAEESLHHPPYTPGFFDSLPPEGSSFDLQAASQVPRERLDLSQLQGIVTEHSKRLGASVPTDPDEDWYEYRLQQMGLLMRDESGETIPTNAAVILCSDEGRSVSRGHWVEIKTPDRPPNAVDGSLLHIYQRVFDTLLELNRPIRIKGYRSKEQLPYGPIAIKELLANALVHRDYQSSDPTTIFIGKDHITFENPGGLDEPIIRKMSRTPGATNQTSVGEEFQERVFRRDVGSSFTAYRNPVLADVFWGLGYVDKRGSGLMDAVHSLKEIGAGARIQVPESNDGFIATISMPSIKIDDLTHTAIPKRPTLYYSNLVEFDSVPTMVWMADSHITSPRDSALYAGDRVLPSFSLRNSRLYSFSDLSNDECTLRLLIDPQSIRAVRVDEVMNGVSTDTVIPELLRKVVEYRMSNCGLRVDRRRRRAYYACYTRPFRSISYQSTRQRTSRRVAWWPERLGVGHCVHTAINYQVVLMRQTWGLMLQPTYVITTDGRSRQPPYREHSSIVTRLMSEHYNAKVLADVRFWLNQLETDIGVIRIEQDSSPSIRLDTHPVTYEGYSANEQEAI